MSWRRRGNKDDQRCPCPMWVVHKSITNSSWGCPDWPRALYYRHHRMNTHSYKKKMSRAVAPPIAERDMTRAKTRRKTTFKVDQGKENVLYSIGSRTWKIWKIISIGLAMSWQVSLHCPKWQRKRRRSRKKAAFSSHFIRGTMASHAMDVVLLPFLRSLFFTVP